MDAALVRMMLQSIIDGSLEVNFDKGEERSAIRWLKDREWMTRRDVGGEPQHFPEMAQAAALTERALSCYYAKNREVAKAHALDALRLLTGR